MSALVVDASVAAKWFSEEDNAQAALSVLDGQHTLHVPDFFFLEMDNIIGKWIRRGIISDSEGADMRNAMRRVSMKVHSFLHFQDSAYYLAVQSRQSIYDCLYVALAKFVEGRMVTADRRLVNAFVPGPMEQYLVWIEDV